MGNQIAGIIVEPVAGNMNCILPQDGFLQTLREVCDQYHSVLIFDEVMSGFRVAKGGAQDYYNITPDLTTLGKIIGGGFPVGAFGGNKQIMQHVAPLGNVYQAGTLSGNPISVCAGLAMLEQLDQVCYTQLENKIKTLSIGIIQAAKIQNISMTANAIGGMFGLFFTNDNNINNFKQSTQCNIKQFNQFFHGMLDRGIYLAPSAYEAGFISTAHTDINIADTIIAATEVFKKIN
jgi:glutamate-1-semialdehyde 2,1-aminomutase